MSDKKKRSSTERARRIWLAGLGAYGRAFTETKEALKDVTGEASDVFDELVQKGQMVEMAVGMKSKEAMDKAGVGDMKMPDIKIPDLKIDDRIAKMRERLKATTGFDVSPVPASDLEDRVAALEAKLDLVLKQLNAPARKVAAKKAPVKKTATKKTTTRKTAPKKSD